MNLKELKNILGAFGDDQILILRADNSGGMENIDEIKIEPIIEFGVKKEQKFALVFK